MTRLAWGAAVVLLFIPCVVSAQNGNDEEARRHFRVGSAYYENGQFAQAATEFDTAYGLSHRPQLLYNVFVAHRDAGDLREATDALRQYLALVPDAQNHDQLQARLSVMERQVAQLPPTGTSTTTTTTGTGTTTTTTGATGTGTGTGTTSGTGSETGTGTTTTTTGTGSETGTGTTTTTTDTGTTGGSTSAAVVGNDTTAAPAGPNDEGGGGPGPVPFIVGGVGIAAIGAAAVFGILASGNASTLASMCPTHMGCDPSLMGTASDGKTFALVADVLGIAGGVAVGAAIALFFVMQGHHSADHAPTASAMCTGTGCMADVRFPF